jgi:hypothetical protein
MKKEDNKPKRHPVSKKTLEKLKKDLGGKLNLTIEDIDVDGNRKTTYAYKGGMLVFNIDNANMKRELEIEFSAIEEDDEKLLHFLFSKM